jgi:hypothetical protein
MTIDELRGLVDGIFAASVRQLQETGDLMQKIHVIKHDGSIDVIVLGGDITNNAGAKSVLGRILHQRVEAGDVEAIIMASDVFWAQISDENQKIRVALGLNVEQSAAAGLCEMQEAVVVTVETPIWCHTMRQNYRRVGDRIELVGEPEMSDDGKWRAVSGRFSGYWPQREGKPS